MQKNHVLLRRVKRKSRSNQTSVSLSRRLIITTQKLANSLVYMYQKNVKNSLETISYSYVVLYYSKKFRINPLHARAALAVAHQEVRRLPVPHSLRH